ncbi:MAG TPA: DUF4760 domain-containing protein [Xanthobacteraceae bacterium]
MTAQERRITWELGSIYLAYVVIIGAVKMSGGWGTVPQWLTVLIAFGAAVIAVISIRTQRDLARKRAAIDFFLKTEMDSSAVKAFDEYSTIHVEIKSIDDVKKFYDDKKNNEVEKVLRCLGIHELVAVGVGKKVFDEDVCFEFWADELMDAYFCWRPMIEYMREKDKSVFAFAELEKTAEAWKKRDERAVRERSALRG